MTFCVPAATAAHGTRGSGFRLPLAYRVLRASLAALLLGLYSGVAAAGQAPGASVGTALLIDVKGPIGFVSMSQLVKALETAAAQDASLLILRLDTPGGLLSSTRDMIQAMLASSIPIVVYVAPSGARAASAGTYLVYAAHIAAMAPGTHLGAATPIQLGVPGLPGTPAKPEPQPEKTSEPDPATASDRKAVNDAAAYLRTLAELRGRNAEWAEKAVRDASTLTATEALEERVIDLNAGNVGELLAAIDGRSVTTATGEKRLATTAMDVVELEPTLTMQVLSAIADPNIAFILFLIGVYGIFFEFMNPGAVAPGVIGGISLIIALTALSVLPVNYGGLALLLLGLVLMALEAAAPSFGALGLGGIVAFIVGALFLFDPAEADYHFAVAWPLIIAAAASSALLCAGVVGFALKARGRPVQTGPEEMIGSKGVVVNWSNGYGLVRVHGEIWSARAAESLTVGQEVRVAGRTGLTLAVEAAP